MHVSGDLVQLPSNTCQIPLAWHCRAPLGLKTGTSVHIALVASGGPAPRPEWAGAAKPKDEGAHEGAAVDGGQASRPPIAAGESPPSPQADREAQALYRPPDLLVSVLDPRVWDTTYLIESQGPDGPGLLNQLLDEIAKLNTPERLINVLIGESFTIPTRTCDDPLLRFHKTSLYCQLLVKDSLKKLEKMRVDLNRAAGFRRPEDGPVHLRQAPLPAGVVVRHLGQADVQHGLVETDVDWRKASYEVFMDLMRGRTGIKDPKAICDQFDYSLACTLADLDARAIRLTFPLKAARRLETRHTDEPNVAVQVTSQLSPDYSILAGLLAKSDAASGEMDAVCEPLPGKPGLPKSPFPALRNTKDFRKLESHDAKHYQNVLYPQLPVEELIRQVVKLDREKRDTLLKRLLSEGSRLSTEQVLHQLGLVAEPYGAKARQLVTSFFGEIARVAPATPKAKITCGIVVAADVHRASSARVLLKCMADQEGLCVEEMLGGGSDVREFVRRFHLVTRDLAIFVAWNTPGRSEVMADAIAFEYLANEKANGLLLIESTPDDVNREFSGVFRRVRPVTFEWKPRHTEAIARMVDAPDEELPEAILDDNFLISRVYEWMSETDALKS